VASAAADVASIADALGVSRFAVMGHSGGAPHALACGALLPERALAGAWGGLGGMVDDDLAYVAPLGV
jgi:pimeloyl-ACP methyl ester carboxylesterase